VGIATWVAVLVIGLVIVTLFVMAVAVTRGSIPASLVPTVLACVAAAVFIGFLADAKKELTLAKCLETIGATVAFMIAAVNAGLKYGPQSAHPAGVDGWAVPASIIVVCIVVGCLFLCEDKICTCYLRKAKALKTGVLAEGAADKHSEGLGD
jgi:UDP-N-acetylmuramyl pentapeptide phosphotransferase/UDP-N-acetylglucosamine-1-phosphate transferase